MHNSMYALSPTKIDEAINTIIGLGSPTTNTYKIEVLSGSISTCGRVYECDLGGGRCFNLLIQPKTIIKKYSARLKC